MAHADADTLASIRKAGIIVGTMLNVTHDPIASDRFFLSRAFTELRAAYFQATGTPLQWVDEDVDEIEGESHPKTSECTRCAQTTNDPHAAAVRYQKHHA